MSFPNIPPEGINPIDGLDSEQVALLLLVSIAFEELGLAHIINAEAEKLQGAIGTLVDANGDPINPFIQAGSLAELLAANREVEKMLRTIIKKEMLLQFKFENILEFLSTSTSTTTSTTTTTTTSTTTTSEVRKQNCEVLRHEATIEITQPAGAFFTYFTDLTENHYKAMIDVILETPTGAPLTAQLIVTPRIGNPTIIDFAGAAAIQIEDARSVSLSSTSGVSGAMNIIKDFCICCPDFGEVHRHEATVSFRGSNFLFTDLTDNHYKAMVIVKGRQGGQVVVTPRMGNTPPIALPPLGQSVIQIEDAQSLSVTTGAIDQGPPNTVQIIKDFCISCPDQSNDQRF
ncbi:hypothetical protein ACFY5J_24075 [Peribacillus butanolivorans]|uniref:hypothetical protein n=1 Tax=Peribacillus butanolivorans TaxID=421767 RepID=UPI0036B96D93